MITVSAARKIVQQYCQPLSAVKLPFAESANLILAETVKASYNIPFFCQSSMDGYAIRYAEREKKLIVEHAFPAGSSATTFLEPGTAAKVFTGGPIPQGADTVVQKEWVEEEAAMIRIVRGELQLGMHIRMPGSDIEEGQCILPGGTILNAMHTGLLAASGVAEVCVIPKPSVAIIITGNELIQPGTEPAYGKVFESNSFSLQAILRQLGITGTAIYFARDEMNETADAIGKALQNADMLLVTGGVSVGDFDFVAAACAANQITERFHGVMQRPGKPLYFGTKGAKPVFGLPGNPASVLSCFYQYVLPAVAILSGKTIPEKQTAPLKNAFEKKAPLTFFLKGKRNGEQAEILTGQASYQLHSFAAADCWIELPQELSYFPAGTEVIIHPFI